MKQVNQLEEDMQAILKQEELALCPPDQSSSLSSEVSAMLYLPDDEMLIVGTSSGAIKFYDEGTEENSLLKVFAGGHVGSEISCLYFCKHTKLLISGSANGITCLWSLSTNRLEHVFYAHHSRVVGAAVLYPYPLVVICNQVGMLTLWTMEVSASFDQRNKCILTLLNYKPESESGNIRSNYLEPISSFLYHPYFGESLLKNSVPFQKEREEHESTDSASLSLIEKFIAKPKKNEFKLTGNIKLDFQNFYNGSLPNIENKYSPIEFDKIMRAAFLGRDRRVDHQYIVLGTETGFISISDLYIFISMLDIEKIKDEIIADIIKKDRLKKPENLCVWKQVERACNHIRDQTATLYEMHNLNCSLILARIPLAHDNKYGINPDSLVKDLDDNLVSLSQTQEPIVNLTYQPNLSPPCLMAVTQTKIIIQPFPILSTSPPTSTINVRDPSKTSVWHCGYDWPNEIVSNYELVWKTVCEIEGKDKISRDDMVAWGLKRAINRHTQEKALHATLQHITFQGTRKGDQVDVLHDSIKPAGSKRNMFDSLDYGKNYMGIENEEYSEVKKLNKDIERLKLHRARSRDKDPITLELMEGFKGEIDARFEEHDRKLQENEEKERFELEEKLNRERLAGSHIQRHRLKAAGSAVMFTNSLKIAISKKPTDDKNLYQNSSTKHSPLQKSISSTVRRSARAFDLKIFSTNSQIQNYRRGAPHRIRLQQELPPNSGFNSSFPSDRKLESDSTYMANEKANHKEKIQPSLSTRQTYHVKGNYSSVSSLLKKPHNGARMSFAAGAKTPDILTQSMAQIGSFRDQGKPILGKHRRVVSLSQKSEEKYFSNVKEIEKNLKLAIGGTLNFVENLRENYQKINSSLKLKNHKKSKAYVKIIKPIIPAQN